MSSTTLTWEILAEWYCHFLSSFFFPLLSWENILFLLICIYQEQMAAESVDRDPDDSSDSYREARSIIESQPKLWAANLDLGRENPRAFLG